MALLVVNGRKIAVDVEPMPLLWALRDELGLVGTKFGSGAGLCGCREPSWLENIELRVKKAIKCENIDQKYSHV